MAAPALSFTRPSTVRWVFCARTCREGAKGENEKSVKARQSARARVANRVLLRGAIRTLAWVEVQGCESVFNFLLIVHDVFFVDVAFFIDRGQLQRIAGDNFEVGSALIALDDFAFFNIIDIAV